MTRMAEFVRVAAIDDVPPGSLLGVEVDGHSICLVNTEGEIYALRNNCTHRDFPLDTGELENGQVTCSWHGARFDVKSGRAVRLPAIKPVATYDVKVEDGEIFISL
jgi:3-phenylpropionate/trans-cinnamate dioxygenase ferredoxin component